MGVVYFNGTDVDEQARGGNLDSGTMQAYAVRRDRPNEMIYLGGHFMDDAPSYNITEGKILPIYKHVAGRNIVEEKQITEDIIKSVTFNLMLPHKAISVTDRLYQNQKSCEYDVVFVPDECNNDCDSYFLVARDVKFGAKQLTSTILGYDDNANPITNMRTLRASGNLVAYYGLQGSTLSLAEDLLSIDIVKQRCEGCDCPYQNVVVGGDGFFAYSNNGGNLYTQYTYTAITTALTTPVFHDVLYVNGNVVFVATDNTTTAPTAESLLGYVNYTTNSAAAISELDGASSLQPANTKYYVGLVEAFGKVFAYGLDIVAVSCDNGVTFTEIADATILNGAILLDAVYDSGSGLLVFAADDRSIVTYDNNKFSLLDTAAFFPSVVAGTHDFRSVAVGSPGHIYLGSSNGAVLEIDDITELSATNPFTLISNESGSAITYIGADKNNVRVIWNEVGTDVIKSRDASNKMIPYVLYTHGETLEAGVMGQALLDEGENYFVLVGAGALVTVSACGICINSGC